MPFPTTAEGTRFRQAILLAAPVALALSLPAWAEAPSAGLGMSGGTGLLRVPTARIAPHGNLAIGVGGQESLVHGFLTATPIPRVEVTLGRSIASANSLASPAEVKILAVPEGPDAPQMAVGARTTAAGGGAYVAFSRRHGALDLSAGLGTGNLAARGDIPLPIAGWRLAPFAGVELAAPVPGLALRLEWDSGTAPAGRAALPVNMGAVWQPLPWLDLGLAWEQGERLSARLALRLPLAAGPGQDPPPASGPLRRPGPASRHSAERRIRDSLESAGLTPVAVAVADTSATVWLDRLPDGPEARSVGRAARLMAAEAPPAVERLDVVVQPDRLAGTTVSLMRRDLERAAAHRGSPAELWRTARLQPAIPAPAQPTRWDLRLTPRLMLDPWSSDRPLAERVMVDGSIAHADGHWRSGAGLRGNLLARLPASAPWPAGTGRAVRRDLADHAAIPISIEHLFLGWVGSPGPGWHLRLDSGLLDESFAGYGAELLWRPLGARWAVGASGEIVWRRLPGIPLVEAGSLQTGFLSLYHEGSDLPTMGALHLGRYLGGDAGATLELGQRLDGGVLLSAWGTVTSAGSGGLAGLRLSVPLGQPAPWARVSAETELRPLARDAGQRVDRKLPLYDLTSAGSYGRIAGSWPRILD